MQSTYSAESLSYEQIVSSDERNLLLVVVFGRIEARSVGFDPGGLVGNVVSTV